MKLNSRRKGKTGEREAYKVLVASFGKDNVKNLTILQTSQKYMPEIILFNAINIEIKRNEKWRQIIKKALTQSQTTAIVNNIPYYAVMARGNYEKWNFIISNEDQILSGDIDWFKEYVNELQKLLSKGRNS